jgi:hypothetical protein
MCMRQNLQSPPALTDCASHCQLGSPALPPSSLFLSCRPASYQDPYLRQAHSSHVSLITWTQLRITYLETTIGTGISWR